MRLISSQSFQPTSPAHSSLVPGLKVKRKGLRRPWAMIRRALASLLAAIGLSARAAPVAGLTRMMLPSRLAGSPPVRTSWLRRAPPSAVGGVRVVPAALGGSPQGFLGVGEPAEPPYWP